MPEDALAREEISELGRLALTGIRKTLWRFLRATTTKAQELEGVACPELFLGH
jgi:hypothetical protein